MEVKVNEKLDNDVQNLGGVPDEAVFWEVNARPSIFSGSIKFSSIVIGIDIAH